MTCIALKRNSELCRNYACLELEGGCVVRGFTCSAHRNFFQDIGRVKKSWASLCRWSRRPEGLGRHLEYYPSHVYHIDESLKAGLVSITKEDVRQIWYQDRDDILRYREWGVYLMLIVRHTPEFRPSWHPDLWNYSMRHMWRLLQSYGPVTFVWKDIQKMMCFPESLSSWYRALELYPYIEEEIGYTTGDFYRFFEDCLKDEEFRAAFVLESEESILENRKRSGVSWHSNAQKILESEGFLEWRRKLKADWYAEQKAKCDVFKEELVAFTWHPDRFMNCLDWEEKRDILERW